jgi:catechol 2,3-dioxygenase-like lactoylglutathione lyase family enzyme
MAWTQDHVHLRCNDYEAVLRFFEENLDAREESRVVNGERVTVTIRMGGILYKISPKREGQSLPHHEIYHLGFETDDLPGAVEKLKARGIKITQEPVHNPPQRSYAFAEGPDGISLELIQRGKP